MQAPKRAREQPNERQPACQTLRLQNLAPAVLLFFGRGRRFAICLAGYVDNQSLGGHFDKIVRITEFFQFPAKAVAEAGLAEPSEPLFILERFRA